MTDADIIRRWIVERVTLAADNDRRVYEKIKEAVSQRVETGDSDGDDPEGDYLAAKAAGEAVTEVLEEFFRAQIRQENSFTALVLSDVLDLHDGTQQAMFGRHYIGD